MGSGQYICIRCRFSSFPTRCIERQAIQNSSRCQNRISSTTDNHKLGIFPWFDTYLVLADDWFTVFAKVDGYHALNTFQDRIRENPWVTANELFDMYVPWDVKAGFIGTVADRFQYKIYGAYRYAKNNVYYGAQSSPTAFSAFTT